MEDPPEITETPACAHWEQGWTIRNAFEAYVNCVASRDKAVAELGAVYDWIDAERAGHGTEE
ncbi:MAG: hypothetical protein AAF719_01245 [Pseudomonadota bacterium]